jgi:Co/Zn/Cd efflux system component
MKDCCEVTADYTAQQRRVLRVVLWINVAMFLVESGAGVLAHSTALLADSVDMLGDAIVYGFSLYVVGRGPIWQARGALLKGAIMAAFGAGVLTEVAVKIVSGVVPAAETIGVIGALALIANAACLVLLWPRRTDDVNMRSAWTCSLNDVAGNAGVLLAGAGVALTGRAWPDIAVGLVIAALFVVSSIRVISDARRHLRLGGTDDVCAHTPSTGGEERPTHLSRS